MKESTVQKGYEYAREVYGAYGIDTEQVFAQLDQIKVSLHCWQGDDIGGFEVAKSGSGGGGTLVTGNYPGRARTAVELRQDLDQALALIPGKHKVNLHAIYLESDGQFIDRDEIEFSHFGHWVAWAKKNGLGLDFNPTFFAHRLAGGLTLASADDSTRDFWVRHGQRTREIAAQMGETLGMPCVNNVWTGDGFKDTPVDRAYYRSLFKDSLDRIFEKKFSEAVLVDTVESKLFGIGVESCTIGSHEFLTGYALKNNVKICLDMGHFHQTESIADKISAVLAFQESLLLHVSRPVRWDSDHVVILNDDLVALMQELKRCEAFGKVHIALDYFDASINRVTAWVTGTRAALKAILFALLEPTDRLRQAELAGNFGDRLALLEEAKSLPFGAVWDQYCLTKGVPAGSDWLPTVTEYERNVLSKRA